MQAEYKRGECLTIVFFYFLDGLFTCGSIHQGLDPELFSDESRGTREIYICLAVLFADSRINEGARQDIDH